MTLDDAKAVLIELALLPSNTWRAIRGREQAHAVVRLYIRKQFGNGGAFRGERLYSLNQMNTAELLEELARHENQDRAVSGVDG